MYKNLNTLATMLDSVVISDELEYFEEISNEDAEKISNLSEEDFIDAIAAVNPEFDFDNNEVSEVLAHETTRAAREVLIYLRDNKI